MYWYCEKGEVARSPPIGFCWTGSRAGGGSVVTDDCPNGLEKAVGEKERIAGDGRPRRAARRGSTRDQRRRRAGSGREPRAAPRSRRHTRPRAPAMTDSHLSAGSGSNFRECACMRRAPAASRGVFGPEIDVAVLARQNAGSWRPSRGNPSPTARGRRRWDSQGRTAGSMTVFSGGRPVGCPAQVGRFLRRRSVPRISLPPEV